MDSRGKSVRLVTVFVALLQLAPVSVDSYPIFGTKRFQQQQRNTNSPALLPFVAPVQIFTPIQAANTAGGIDPMDGYYADDPSNYLYYAPHDPKFHSYGMPVYHGDYKPSPYLYAQGPTYQYYDDKEATNPLDDLHEEMLEEDEREREEKEQLMRHQYDQQQRHYQQQQQLINDEYPDLMQPRNYYQPMYEIQQPGRQQRQHQPHQPQWQPSMDYGEGYDVEEEDDSPAMMIEPSSAYAQANAAFLNDLIQYNRQISRNSNNNNGGRKSKTANGDARSRNVHSTRKDYNANWNFDYPTNHEEQMDQDSYDYDAPSYSSMPHKSSDDKAVRELQALTHSRDKTSQSSTHALSRGGGGAGLQKVDFEPLPAEEQSNYHDYWSDGPSMGKDSELTANNNNNYEYEDGGDEWINWDSKRSAVKPISIVAFTDRKPLSKIMITKVPENHFVLDGEDSDGGDSITAASTMTSSSSSSTEGDKDVDKAAVKSSATDGGKSGQKEEVVMRPAPPVRHPFSAPVMKMLEHQESLNKNKYESHAAVEDLDNKKRTVENSGSSSKERRPKATVYDTIKHLLDMEQHLKNSAGTMLSSHGGGSTSRIQKRFVSNEGSLVKQLDSLKRMKV